MTATRSAEPSDTSSTERAGPLQGLRIVEISGYVATPLCGMTLAQLGADVIRVEPVGGAPDRTRLPLAPSGTSLYWSGLNKGKRAITADLSTQAGRELVTDLVVERGIVLTNSARILPFEGLRERRPDVVHVVLTGTHDGANAVDYTVNAATGFATVTGAADRREPVNHVLPAWDVSAGLYLAVGLLSAVRERDRTGQAQQVRVALEDVALALIGNLGLLAQAQLGEQRGPDGNNVYGTFGRDFATADGQRVMVVALTPRHWHELLELTDSTAVVAGIAAARGVDFDREEERYRHRHLLCAVLAEWFSAHTCAEAEAALKGTRVLWSRFRGFTELVADARVMQQNPLMSRLDQPGVGEHVAPGCPVIVGERVSPARPAPAVGQHTAELLGTELGLGADELARLAEQGVIGVGR